jgi:hypothetical protein
MYLIFCFFFDNLKLATFSFAQNESWVVVCRESKKSCFKKWGIGDTVWCAEFGGFWGKSQKNVCFTKLGSDDKWPAEVVKTGLGECDITINTYGVPISKGDCISWEISPHALYKIRFPRVRLYDTICVLDEDDVLIGSTKGSGKIHIPFHLCNDVKYRIKIIFGEQLWRCFSYYDACSIKYFCLDII